MDLFALFWPLATPHIETYLEFPDSLSRDRLKSPDRWLPSLVEHRSVIHPDVMDRLSSRCVLGSHSFWGLRVAAMPVWDNTREERDHVLRRQLDPGAPRRRGGHRRRQRRGHRAVRPQPAAGPGQPGGRLLCPGLGGDLGRLRAAYPAVQHLGGARLLQRNRHLEPCHVDACARGGRRWSEGTGLHQAGLDRRPRRLAVEGGRSSSTSTAASWTRSWWTPTTGRNRSGRRPCGNRA